MAMSDKTINRLTDRAEIAELRAINAELLEACKFVEDWVNTFLPHQGPAENNLLEKVQAAIRKAEGQP
jgi:hypothetical protein